MKGRAAREPSPLVGPHRMGAGRRPPRPGGAAGGPEPDPGTGPGPRSSRPDDGVAVHVLSGRGQDHGHRLEGHADRWPGSPAVRRRPSVELRGVRVPGAGPAVRSERLRRDPAGAVRVRRQAHGRQFHHRGPQQRLHQGRHHRRHPGLGDGLPGGHGRVRRDGQHGDLVRPPVRARPHERHPLGGHREPGPRRKRRRPSRARRPPARPPRRRIPATACWRCPSWASWSTVATAS